MGGPRLGLGTSEPGVLHVLWLVWEGADGAGSFALTLALQHAWLACLSSSTGCWR